MSLIETALKNNQDLLITFQQIEIAKSGVLAKKGMLNPTVSAGVNAGLKKPDVIQVKVQVMPQQKLNREEKCRIAGEFCRWYYSKLGSRYLEEAKNRKGICNCALSFYCGREKLCSFQPYRRSSR